MAGTPVGEHRGSCGCWQVRDGTRHGAVEKSDTLCLSRALQHAAAGGNTATGSSCGFPSLGFPSVTSPGRASSSVPLRKQPVLPSEQEETFLCCQRAASPAATAKFLRCCPRKESRQRAIAWQHHGKPCEGQLLVAVGQQRDLHLHQVLCHEAGLWTKPQRGLDGGYTWAVSHLLPPPLKAEDKNGTRSGRSYFLFQALERKL